jgi:hypothetical protein
MDITKWLSLKTYEWHTPPGSVPEKWWRKCCFEVLGARFRRYSRLCRFFGEDNPHQSLPRPRAVRRFQTVDWPPCQIETSYHFDCCCDWRFSNLIIISSLSIHRQPALI